MSGPLRVGIGILLVLVGLLWTLQGLGVVGGSAMSGRHPVGDHRPHRRARGHRPRHHRPPPQHPHP